MGLGLGLAEYIATTWHMLHPHLPPSLPSVLRHPFLGHLQLRGGKKKGCTVRYVHCGMHILRPPRVTKLNCTHSLYANLLLLSEACLRCTYAHNVCTYICLYVRPRSIHMHTFVGCGAGLAPICHCFASQQCGSSPLNRRKDLSHMCI